MTTDFRPSSRPVRRLLPCAVARLATLVTPSLQAQPSQTTTISGRAAPPAAVGGFGDQPAARTPMSTGAVSAEQLVEQAITTPAALTRTDASFSDAYNAEGYWSGFSARGYVLDNRYNFRRDGLPINGETALQLSGVERVDLLHGTSGNQAGTSAPGGRVNFVVKRPQDPDQRQLFLKIQLSMRVLS